MKSALIVYKQQRKLGAYFSCESDDVCLFGRIPGHKQFFSARNKDALNPQIIKKTKVQTRPNPTKKEVDICDTTCSTKLKDLCADVDVMFVLIIKYSNVCLIYKVE